MTTNQTITPFEITLNKLSNSEFNRVAEILITLTTQHIESIRGGGQRQTQ